MQTMYDIRCVHIEQSTEAKESSASLLPRRHIQMTSSSSTPLPISSLTSVPPSPSASALFPFLLSPKYRNWIVRGLVLIYIVRKFWRWAHAAHEKQGLPAVLDKTIFPQVNERAHRANRTTPDIYQHSSYLRIIHVCIVYRV